MKPADVAVSGVSLPVKNLVALFECSKPPAPAPPTPSAASPGGKPNQQPTHASRPTSANTGSSASPSTVKNLTASLVSVSAAPAARLSPASNMVTVLELGRGSTKPAAALSLSHTLIPEPCKRNEPNFIKQADQPASATPVSRRMHVSMGVVVTAEASAAPPVTVPHAGMKPAPVVHAQAPGAQPERRPLSASPGDSSVSVSPVKNMVNSYEGSAPRLPPTSTETPVSCKQSQPLSCKSANRPENQLTTPPTGSRPVSASISSSNDSPSLFKNLVAMFATSAAQPTPRPAQAPVPQQQSPLALSMQAETEAWRPAAARGGFDFGKSKYREEHKRPGDDPRQTRHIIGADVLQHYGASSELYKNWAKLNYRMGDKHTNDRDEMMDKGWVGEMFDKMKKDSYDPTAIARNEGGKIAGPTKQNQAVHLKLRFNTLKEAYELSGDPVLLEMQQDLRNLVKDHLHEFVDLRQWVPSKPNALVDRPEKTRLQADAAPDSPKAQPQLARPGQGPSYAQPSPVEPPRPHTESGLRNNGRDWDLSTLAGQREVATHRSPPFVPMVPRTVSGLRNNGIEWDHRTLVGRQSAAAGLLPSGLAGGIAEQQLREQRQRAEQQRAEQQLAEQQRAEQQRAEQQLAEQQRAEQQLQEQRQRAEQQRAEQQRAEQQRAEQQLREQQQRAERAEQQRVAQQLREQRERAEQQLREQQRAEQQRAEQQRAEQQRADDARQQRAEQQRLEWQREQDMYSPAYQLQSVYADSFPQSRTYSSYTNNYSSYAPSSFSSFTGSGCYSWNGNTSGPMTSRGMPDMRYSCNRM
jgi:hypothetical protein